MVRRTSLHVLAITALLALSFTAGFNRNEAAAGNWKKLWTAVQMMPDRLRMLSETPEGEYSQVPVLETYWGVLTELTNQYYGAKLDEKKLTYSAIRGMLAGLNDQFTRFLDPDEYRRMREENEGNFVGIGAQLDANKNRQIYIKEPLPESPAIEAGLKSGDVIVKVNEKTIAGMLIEDVVKIIRGAENTKVKLTIQRPVVISS